MDKMIERYIYDVTRRLPEKERGEIKRELEASIADMLPENPNKQDINDVLIKLGAPRLLAERYRQAPRYLISPAMFDSYVYVLKTVVTIVAVTCGTVGAALALSSASIANIIAGALGMAFEGALQSVLWITIGFVIAERVGNKQEWKPEDLPNLPTGIKIPRSSSIAGIIMSVFLPALFTAMIIRGEWFFVFVRGTEVISPFSHDALVDFIPFIILLGGMGVAVNSFKLYWGKWNVPLCVINIVYNVVWAVVAIYGIFGIRLFNGEFLELTSTYIPSADVLLSKVVSVVILVVAAVEIIVGIWKTRKGMAERV